MQRTVQGEEREPRFPFSSLKNLLFTLLMGRGDSVCNRDCIGHKRVTAIALRASLLPVGLSRNGANFQDALAKEDEGKSLRRGEGNFGV